MTFYRLLAEDMHRDLCARSLTIAAAGPPIKDHELADRFWPRVDCDGPLVVHELGRCWRWTGAVSTSGYGRLSSRGTTITKSTPYAHRVSYEIHIGGIPDGFQLDHLCRNRRCVNPAHLEIVTSRENTMRGTSPTASNARKTHCHRGHPFDDANTIRLPGRPGERACRACKNERRRLSVVSAPPPTPGGGATPSTLRPTPKWTSGDEWNAAALNDPRPTLTGSKGRGDTFNGPGGSTC